jgi:hypothetical protein
VLAAINLPTLSEPAPATLSELGPATLSEPVQRPAAKFYGQLTAHDSHQVNHAVVREVVSKNHDTFVLPGFCAQHRTGSVVEGVTNELGLLTPCFCIANTLQQGDTFQSVRDHVKAILEEEMLVVTPSEWRRRHEHKHGGKDDFARAVLETCFVRKRVVSDQNASVSDQSASVSDQNASVSDPGRSRREQLANAFLQFFRSDWRGVATTLL